MTTFQKIHINKTVLIFSASAVFFILAISGTLLFKSNKSNPQPASPSKTSSAQTRKYPYPCKEDTFTCPNGIKLHRMLPTCDFMSCTLKDDEKQYLDLPVAKTCVRIAKQGDYPRLVRDLEDKTYLYQNKDGTLERRQNCSS